MIHLCDFLQQSWNTINFPTKKGVDKTDFLRHFQPLPVGGTVILSNSKVLPIRQVEAVQLNFGEILGISCPKTISFVFSSQKVCQTFFIPTFSGFFTRLQHGFLQFLQLRFLHDLSGWQNGKITSDMCRSMSVAWRQISCLPSSRRSGFSSGNFFSR